MSTKMKRIRITVEVPAIVGDVLLRAFNESRTVQLVPQSILPGYIATILEAKEVKEVKKK